jgi:hypothetical protein
MTGVELARQRLLQLAATPYGVARHDINSRIDATRRAAARIALAELIDSGVLHPAAGWRKDGTTWFVVPEAAAAWVAAGRPMRPNVNTHEPWEHKPKRDVKMVPAPKAAKPKSVAPKPAVDRAPARSSPRATVCPSKADGRYTVRSLPDGYQSNLNPNECRGWAAAVAR